MTANILFQADGGKLPKTASDIGKQIAQDVPIGATPENIIRELNRAKCAFQLRTIELVLRGSTPPAQLANIGDVR